MTSTNGDALLYGERAAPVYDEDAPPCGERLVEALVTLAGRGRVLELGIGTGRVALPLARRGVNVEGIDISPAMVARMRAKPGGADIPVTMGSFADLAVDGRFELIYVVYNTFYMLRTQEEQVRCLRGAAEHLRPGGSLLIEGFLLHADTARESEGAPDRITLDYVGKGATGVRNYAVELRVPSLAGLDRMARRAGLRMSARWSDWDATPFSDLARAHISIYSPSRRRRGNPWRLPER